MLAGVEEGARYKADTQAWGGLRRRKGLYAFFVYILQNESAVHDFVTYRVESDGAYVCLTLARGFRTRTHHPRYDACDRRQPRDR